MKSEQRKSSPNDSITTLADLHFRNARTGASCLIQRYVKWTKLWWGIYIHFLCIRSHILSIAKRSAYTRHAIMRWFRCCLQGFILLHKKKKYIDEVVARRKWEDSQVNPEGQKVGEFLVLHRKSWWCVYMCVQYEHTDTCRRIITTPLYLYRYYYGG